MSIKNREKKAMVKKTNGAPFLWAFADCALTWVVHHSKISTVSARPACPYELESGGMLSRRQNSFLACHPNSAREGATVLNLAQSA